MKLERRIMGAIADFVIRHHKIIPIAAVVLLVLSVVAAQNIRVTTQMEDMLPFDDPQVKSIHEIDETFNSGMSLMITVEGRDKQRMGEAAEAFAAAVRQSPEAMRYVKTINLKMDRSFLTQWGLMLQEATDLEQSRKTFAELNLLPFLGSLNDSFERTYTGEEAEEEISTHRQESEAVAMLNQLEAFFGLLREYLENPAVVDAERTGEELARTFMYGDLYGFSPDNGMLLFSILPNFSIDDIQKMIDMTAEIKKIRRDIQEAFPDLVIAYTGEVAIGADEQAAMGFDMLVPALVALAVILLLFVFSFNPIRSVVFALIVLVFGIAYTYGLLGVTFKEITMLTSFMAVMLIGLGIDYGIQLVTNYTTYRASGLEPAEALRSTYVRSGMGTFLAALTTAIGFFVMAATGSKALAEFGVLAGMGIICCFVALFFILPSLLFWFVKRDPARSRLPKAEYRFLARLGAAAFRHRWITLAVGLLVTAGLLAAAFFNRMEYDIMKLEPAQMTSIRMYYRVLDEFDVNIMSAMAVADSVEEARELQEALEQESLIAEVSSVARFIPSDGEQVARLDEIRRIRAMGPRYVPDYPYTPERMEELAYQVQRLEWNIIEMGDLSVAGLGENNKIVVKRNRIIREIFGAEVGEPGAEVFQKVIRLIEEDPEAAAGALTAVDRSFAAEMDRIVEDMSRVDRKIRLKDLPDQYAKQFLEEGGSRNLVFAYPVKSATISKEGMLRFNERMARISPKITGWVPVMVSWSEDVETGSKKAALYIFLVVFAVMVITFRSFRYAILAAVPLLAGMIWMLGIYPLLGLKLNMINIAVIPLVIGMGIDFGIHIVHRFRVERDLETVYRFTGKAVFLSALTTIIGFGSLALIGSFPSIASIGTILFLGIATCLVATIVLLPALLSLVRSREGSDE
ncbi:MAG: MMPL family transporter [Spirochaetales bacterium]|nr:MMPL family transporter [Spirochaetales bacterium]